MTIDKAMTWTDDDGVLQSVQYARIDGVIWAVSTWWSSSSGRLEPVSVAIAANDGRPVQADLIRKLPLGSMQKAARAAANKIATQANAALRSRNAKFYAELGKAHRGRTMTDSELQATADVYLKAWMNGDPVTAAVASAFNISISTAGKRIMRARAAGKLDIAARDR